MQVTKRKPNNRINFSFGKQRNLRRNLRKTVGAHTTEDEKYMKKVSSARDFDLFNIFRFGKPADWFSFTSWSKP